jgi:hypothetical protein
VKRVLQSGGSQLRKFRFGVFAMIVAKPSGYAQLQIFESRSLAEVDKGVDQDVKTFLGVRRAKYPMRLGMSLGFRPDRSRRGRKSLVSMPNGTWWIRSGGRPKYSRIASA